jgi:hypothetical protein
VFLGLLGEPVRKEARNLKKDFKREEKGKKKQRNEITTTDFKIKT